MTIATTAADVPAPDAACLALHSSEFNIPGPKLLIVVDRRTVIGRCLSFWIGSLGPDFETANFGAIDSPLCNQLLANASAVILAAGASDPSHDPWIQDQVAMLRKSRPEVPLVLLSDSDYDRLIEPAVRKFGLSGYIPASTSSELAAAALRLIVAGGRYVPEPSCDKTLTARPNLGVLEAPSKPAELDKLTPREREVLELLERGMPNKIIAYRLGLSLSTVKVHVHKTITKLKVRNRTEAAVVRYAIAGRQNETVPAGHDRAGAIEAPERSSKSDQAAAVMQDVLAMRDAAAPRQAA